MIGVPPVCGFVTKFGIAGAAAATHNLPILAALMASTVLNAAYFGPIVYRAFFVPAKDPAAMAGYREAPAAMVAPLCFTAAASVLLGVFPWVVYDFIYLLGRP